MNASFSDLTCEHRPESVPPALHRLVTYINTALEQEILGIVTLTALTSIGCSV